MPFLFGRLLASIRGTLNALSTRGRTKLVTRGRRGLVGR